jgi:hypothetical protein
MESEGKVVRLAAGAIVATYREIADHFGLSSPEKGRQKAKRAGWLNEPQNHPADPVRVRVPQEAWEEASRSRARAARFRAQGRERGAPLIHEDEGPQGGSEPPSKPDEPPPLLKQLEAVHATLREQLDRAEERAKRAEDRATRLEAEREVARAQAAAAEDEARALRAQADRAEKELADWTAGGPLARAWRAFLSRRGRL